MVARKHTRECACFSPNPLPSTHTHTTRTPTHTRQNGKRALTRILAHHHHHHHHHQQTNTHMPISLVSSGVSARSWPVESRASGCFFVCVGERERARRLSGVGGGGSRCQQRRRRRRRRQHPAPRPAPAARPSGDVRAVLRPRRVSRRARRCPATRVTADAQRSRLLLAPFGALLLLSRLTPFLPVCGLAANTTCAPDLSVLSTRIFLRSSRGGGGDRWACGANDGRGPTHCRAPPAPTASNSLLSRRRGGRRRGGGGVL